jgi:hypothetical protein
MARFALLPLLARSVAALGAMTALAAVSSLTGCDYTRHEAGYANGERGQLYFATDASSSISTVAVGVMYTVTVSRIGAQDVDCRGLGLRSAAPGAGGLHAQGGSINTDKCDATKADPVKFVSASCEDDACSIDAETTNEHFVTLHVTGKRAADPRLLVSLTSADGSTTYEDAKQLHFGVPTRIRLKVADSDLPATKSPVLTGFAISPPRAAIVDAQERELFTGTEPPAPTYVGDAYVPALAETRLVATRSGHTVIHWHFAGVPERTLDLEVVDPSEARALFVFARLPTAPAGAPPPKGSDPIDFAEDPSTSGGRVTSLELESSYRHEIFPTRVSLADGRLALGKLESVEVLPYDIAYAITSRESSFLEVNGRRVGEGTLTVRAAPGATLTLPVKVTAPPKL